MFKILIWKEIREHLMTFRFAAALVTTLLLVIISVWVLGDDFQRRRDAYNLAAEESARNDMQVVVPSQIRPTVHRAPSVLSIFAQGEDRRFGNTVLVQRWEVPRRAEGSFTDNMLLAAEPALDLYTIFALVVSLFGILFSYDAVSGERERGTLKIQCSVGAGRAPILVSKLLGGIICLAIPFIFSFLSGLLLLSLFFGMSFTGEQWSAVAMMLLAGLVYGGLFVATGLTCSALMRKSSAALILSLLVWAIGVLLLPSAAANAAGVIAPLPSSAELANAEKTSLQEAAAALEEFGKVHPRYWTGLLTGGWSIPGRGGCFKFDGGVAHYVDGAAWVHTIEPIMQRRAGRIWDLYNGLEERRLNHSRMFDLISAASPAMHLRKAFTSLAITDYQAYGGFLESARRHRRLILSQLESRGYFADNAWQFFSRRPTSEITDDLYAQRHAYLEEQMALGKRGDEILDPVIAWGFLAKDEIPQFAYTEPASDFGVALLHIGVLVAMLCFAFAIGLVAILRYDVR
ncbi:MAG TPA: ABC transporter permease subunit [Acidobacteriota bacterium]|nr:ABC transporter permease subunit [Acidobacteriota bacterium]